MNRLILFTTLLFLIPSSRIDAQTFYFKWKLANPPLELVGKMDESVLYAPAFDFRVSNEVKLVSIENEEFVVKHTIYLPDEFIYKIFLHKDHFFLFTSQYKTGAFSLVELDDNLAEINRTELILPNEAFSIKDISIQDNIPRTFRYFQKNEHIGICLKRTQNRFVIINLESMQFASHVSDLKKDSEYTIEDCLFGDNADAVFLLGTQNDTEAFVICNDKTHRNVVIPFQNKQTGDYCRSFKFVEYEGANYLTSFYNNTKKKEQGYSFTPIPDFNFTSLNLEVFPDLTLDNPAIWTLGQYKKVKKGSLPIETYSLKMVSAEVHQGSLLIKAQEGHEMGKRNIQISSIDLSAKVPKVKWTYINHYIVDNFLTYTTMQGEQNFVSFNRDGYLEVIYNGQTNHLTKEGKVDLSGFELLSENQSFPQQDSRLVKARINLESGEFESKTIEPLEGSRYLGKITSPNYEFRDNQLILLLQSSDFTTYQFSKPVIRTFPMD